MFHHTPEDTSPLRYRFQTLEFGDVDIHLRTLRDTLQYLPPEDQLGDFGISPASWGLFGVIWPSSEALARLMFEHEALGKKILEVGCGIAVPSLVLRKRGADITACDQHPRAGELLEYNVKLNELAPIPFVRTDWADDDDAVGQFDLIIGSDLLYEPDHVDLLSGFIDRHALPTCEVIIVDPNRGHSPKFTRRMEEFGFESETHSLDDYLDGMPFSGRCFRYLRAALAKS